MCTPCREGHGGWESVRLLLAGFNLCPDLLGEGWEIGSGFLLISLISIIDPRDLTLVASHGDHLWRDLQH